MFNIFLNDLFLVLKDTDVCNFADDISPHAGDALMVCWFESNYMKLNTDKCHLKISSNKHESFWADIGNDRIWGSNYFKLLGINIDRSLKFNFHMLKMCSKANRKLTILNRMFRFLTFEKRRVLIKTYFES